MSTTEHRDRHRAGTLPVAKQLEEAHEADPTLPEPGPRPEGRQA